jgi:hypothetical protein
MFTETRWRMRPNGPNLSVLSKVGDWVMPTVGHTCAVDKSRLQALWNEGKASGEPKRVDFADLRQQAREDLRNLGATSMPDT